MKMNDNPTIINIARDFTRYPGGRFPEDGDFSGQRFRDEYLVPALRKNGSVVVELDGTLGYGSSFLEEAFGGLVRVAGFDAEQLNNIMVLKAQNELLLYSINRYITDARCKEAA